VGVFASSHSPIIRCSREDSSPNGPHAADDDRRARLALRYILSNPAITAPIPGDEYSPGDNAVQAVKERRQLDRKEKAELDDAGRRMWRGCTRGTNGSGIGSTYDARVLLLVLCAVGAWAADISGQWKGEWTDSRTRHHTHLRSSRTERA